MDRENEKRLMNLFTKNSGTKKGLLVLSAFLIIFVCLGIIISHRPLPTPQNLLNVIDEEVYAKVEIYGLTDCFATYSTEDKSTNNKYYLSNDEEYIYILELSDEQYEEIAAKLDAGETYELCGMTEYVPDELIDITITTFNEMNESFDMDRDNFYDYISPFYLDAKRTPNTFASFFYSFSLVLGFMEVIWIFIYVMQVVKTKKNIKVFSNKYDLATLMLELDSMEKKEFLKAKTILTNNFLVSYSPALEIIKYDDIVWMYPFTHKVNGVDSTYSIYVMLTDKKLHIISQISASGKSRKSEYSEIYNTIMSKNTKMLVGYTNENIIATKKDNIDETITKMQEKQKSEE